MSKVYLITGTSSGFGRALAEAALKGGNRVVLTARRPESVAKLAEKAGDQALSVKLDVTNAEDRRAAIDATVERFGRLDVLINNAGRGSLGAAEAFSSEQLRDQMEVNFFGAVEMTRAALPLMRTQESGHIMNISSIGGLAAVGGFSLYCASKFALEGFSESLRDEVAPLGIRVTIVEPGAFRTEFAGDANMQPEENINAYEGVIESIRQYLYGSSGQQPGDPYRAALAMIQAVESDAPPLRLMLGADAYELWEAKVTKMNEELSAWREVGENTAFPDAEVGAIGS